MTVTICPALAAQSTFLTSNSFSLFFDQQTNARFAPRKRILKMPGFSDYLAQAVLDFQSGRAPMPAIGNRFLALFTAAPTSDSGTGGTEVSGGSYARVQVAGAVAATASFTTASPNITMTTNPGWVVPGMNVYDVTNSQQIGTVLTYSGTALVLTANAAHASSGSTDSLQFSAWPASSASSGTEPAVTPANVTNTNATITFATSTASWGTVIYFGIYDAVTSGNFLGGDYLGSSKWIPFSCTSASPGVLTVDNAGDAPTNGTGCVVTAKFGGTLPTGTWTGVLTSAGLSGATFNLAVNTSSLGGGLFRQILQQSIPNNITASFSTSTLTLSLA
jgi:hypothetical protein